jgi:serine/threonine protein kinase
MNDEEQFRQLVDRWEDLHEQGQDASVEELCRDYPHLEDRLRKWVRLLRASDWLCKPMVDGNGPTERFDGATTNKDERPQQIPAADFLKNLADSGLVSPADIEGFSSAVDGNALAAQFVEQGKLTQYQADCICRGKTKHLVLGEYVILDVLGSGGMGRVFRALHRKMNRVVALKLLPPSAVDCEESVQRFQREIQAVAKLSHPNIVTAHDAGSCDGIYFFAMDLIDGQDLTQCVKEHGPLPVKEALDCVLQVARGLEYAHGQGVIHRDIKPSNLIVDDAGTVKILDLGVARFEGTPLNDNLTNTGCLLGTVDYMAPEQAINTKQADHRADIYSLGCALYFLLTGEPVYGGETAMERLLAHREHDVPSLTKACPGAPEWLDSVFQKLVAKKPEARFQSMGEVVAALEQCDAGRKKSRFWLRAATGLLVIVAVILVLALKFSYWSNAPVPISSTAPAPRSANAPASPSAAEVKAIEWIFDMGGSVEILANEKRWSVKSMSLLPSFSFTIVKINLAHNRKITDDDLAKLAPLKTTEDLLLGQDTITGVGCRHLAALPNLRTLQLWATRVGLEAVEQVATLNQLTSLNLGNNRNITDAALERIKGMKNLRTLNIGLTSITDEGLKNLRGLSNLTTLSVMRTTVSDNGLADLACLRKLESLNLRETRVTEEGIKRLKAQLPNCQIQQ